MTPADDRDAWVAADPTLCPICGLEACEEHLPVPPRAVARAPLALDPAFLTDAPAVAAEGRALAANGVPYVVHGLVPAIGCLGASVAYTKVGKTTFAYQLGAAVATGRPFLDRPTQQRRVLAIAAEDPPEYTAWLARHLDLPPDVLTFYRHPIQLNAKGLNQIAVTVHEGRYGLVLVASWQAVVSELVRDENDNAGAVRVVEQVKRTTRETAVPWLIDAHSGKGEDQSDDADPSKAMRGASGAASAADYTLSLRYGNGSFGTQRRLSGKGRFVSCPPMVLDYNPADGTYAVASGGGKDAHAETTWRLLTETDAVSAVPQTAAAIAKAAGLVNANGRVTNTHRRQVIAALHGRDGVRKTTETRSGQSTSLFALMRQP
jgi:hypothetical protein